MTKLLMIALAFVCAVSAFGAPRLDPSPFGINGLGFFHGHDNPNVFDEGKEKEAALMKEAGIAWCRIDFWWSVVEPEQGKYQWDFPDKVIDFFKNSNIEVMPILCYSSAWSKGVPPLDDAERARFGEWVYQTVKRYKGRVHAWEIWNEPNIPTFWKPEPREEPYTKLLQIAYKRAKEADPDCVIVGASPCLIDFNFIQGIKDNGGWDSMDVISVHPYSMAGDPIQMDLKTQLARLNDLMDANGKRKPVWITEIGWTTRENDRGSEQDQARNLAQTYAISLASGLERVFWFCMTDWGERWGIRDGDRKKPSYEVMKLLSRQLRNTTARFGNCREAYSEVIFTRPDGKEVLMAWANGRDPVAASLSYKATAQRVTGEPVTTKDDKIELTPMPTLIFPTAGGVYGPGAAFASRKKKNLVVNGDLAYEGAWNRGRHDGSRKEGDFQWAPAPGEKKKVLALLGAKNASWNSMPVPIYPGKKYTATVRVRAQKATGMTVLTLAWWKPDGWGWCGADLSKSISGDAKWTTLRVTGIAPKDAGFVRVDMVSENNTGKVWFDNATLTCEDQPYYW